MIFFEQFVNAQPVILGLMLVPALLYWMLLNARKRKTNTGVNDSIIATNWTIFKGLAPVVFYIILSSYFGEWDRFLNGIFLSMTSLSFFVMSTYELGLGIGIKTNIEIDDYKLKKISFIANSGVIISLILAILVFQAREVSLFIFSVQAMTLFLSVIIFFVVKSMMNLLKLDSDNINQLVQ